MPGEWRVREGARWLTPFSRRTSLGYQVNLLARLLEQALRRRIAVHDVVPGQFPALLALYEREGRSQTELCQLVRIEQPTMANTLNRMQRDGLISRSPDPVDGRRSLVELTARGRELEPVLVEAATAVNAEALAGLSTGEVETLMALLARAIENLDPLRGADPPAGHKVRGADPPVGHEVRGADPPVGHKDQS